MATSEQIIPCSIVQLSDFTTFGQAPGIALLAFGWTKDTTVNGTVNWSNVTQTPFQNQNGFPSLTTITYRGAYSNAAVTYNINDTVTFNGMTWVNISSYTSSASTPTPGNEYGNPGGTTVRWVLYCFEIWKSATTPTMYIKFEFTGNTSNYSQPQMRITVATSDDTNGTMGVGAGNQVTTAILVPTSNISTGTAGQDDTCFFSGDSGGRFALLYWPEFTSDASFFGVERSLSSTGTYYTSPSGAVTPYWMTVSLVFSGSILTQYLINTTGSTWIKPATDTKITTLCYSGVHNDQFESIGSNTGQGGSNFSAPALPIYPLVGWVGNPLTIALSGKTLDFPSAGQFTVQMYGSTRTYLSTRNASFINFGEGGNNVLAMRYD
jgi:hypothetical protein